MNKTPVIKLDKEQLIYMISSGEYMLWLLQEIVPPKKHSGGLTESGKVQIC